MEALNFLIVLLCLCDQSKASDLKARQAGNNGAISPSTFLRRAYHASVVTGTKVYINGGEYSELVDEETSYWCLSSLLSIDLSTNWTNSTVVIGSTVKSSDVPSVVSGGLFYDEQENLLYTGFAGNPCHYNTTPFSADMSKTGVWSFQPDGVGGGNWNIAVAQDNSTIASLKRPLKSGIAYGGGKGYVLSGEYLEVPFNDSTGINLSGMLEFDMRSKELKNITVQGPRWHGNIQYPGLLYVQNYGPQGIFLAFGGDKIWRTAQYPEIDNLITWDVVSVFDPASGKWFDQRTNGNIPQERKEFCVAGIASDNQTFEVFLYAGWGRSLGTRSIVYDEIYILTLLAFHWIKVDYAPVETRHGHTCHAVGGSQVLVIGGLNTTANTLNDRLLYQVPFLGKDKLEQGLGVFDMTKLAWADRYIANVTTYKQSELVQSFYARNNRRAEFNSTDLKNVFDITNFTTFPFSAGPKSGKLSSGSKVGIIVGSISRAAGIAGIFFCIRARRRKHKTKEDTPTAKYLEDKGVSRQELHNTQLLELNAVERAAELASNKVYQAHESDSRQLPVELPAAPWRTSSRSTG